MQAALAGVEENMMIMMKASSNDSSSSRGGSDDVAKEFEKVGFEAPEATKEPK